MSNNSQESVYFKKFEDHEVIGGEDFLPEDFTPCKGTVLVLTPPPKEVSEGGVVLVNPLASSVGRVVSVPKDDPICPVQPGDWIVTRYKDGQPADFGGDRSFCFIQYSDDHNSEILGFFPGDKYDGAKKRAKETRPEVKKKGEILAVVH